MDLETAHLLSLALRNLQAAQTNLDSAEQFVQQVLSREGQIDAPRTAPSPTPQLERGPIMWKMGPAKDVTTTEVDVVRGRRQKPNKRKRKSQPTLEEGPGAYVKQYLLTLPDKRDFTVRDAMAWIEAHRNVKFEYRSIGSAINYLRARAEVSGNGRGKYRKVKTETE